MIDPASKTYKFFEKIKNFLYKVPSAHYDVGRDKLIKYSENSGFLNYFCVPSEKVDLFGFSER